MRILLMLAAPVALAGCGESESRSDSEFRKMQPSWIALQDGSSFARVGSGLDDNQAAMRCWPQDSGKFLCITVGEYRGSISGTMVVRESVSALPKIVFPYADTDNGYSCRQMMGFSEVISRRGETLVSNRLNTLSDRWSRGFVEDYMRKNGVGGSGHFQCLEVLNAVSDGSLATLSTTSVTRDMVD
jgi:hypothetical protein